MAAFPRYGGRFPRNESGALRVFRPVLLTAVLLAVCWGFWSNSQKRLDRLAVQNLFSDETGSLNDAQRDMVLEQIRAVRRESGLVLEVHILRAPPPLERHDGNRVYLDLVPSRRRAYLVLPPLVRRAAGDGFARDVERGLEQDFIGGRWQDGLEPALRGIRNTLRGVTR